MSSVTIAITLATESTAEQRTRDQLLAMLARHDLTKWCVTEQLVIAEGVIPHSHPVLTLNTRHQDNALLLDQYLHEQLHWFLSARRDSTLAAVAECQHLYPGMPIDPPRGAGSASSTYLHVILCYLEYIALTEVLGSDEALRVMTWLAQDHYTTIYQTVLHDGLSLQELIERHGLVIGDPAGGDSGPASESPSRSTQRTDGWLLF